MPELPEVETILQGIKPYVEGQTLEAVIIRQPQLRWAIPREIITKLPHHVIVKASRRGKYLLLQTDNGSAILHFGMSGSLSLLPRGILPNKHDHFDLLFQQFCLRYTDPRRFGALLFTPDNPLQHPLLHHLGPEPLEASFSASYLFSRAQNKKVCIKQFIMDSSVVVGVGNIYAAEALFLANIHPLKSAREVSLDQYQHLTKAIKKVLKSAIKQGGTTLKDFVNSKGKPGYFKQKLNVYGLENKPCKICQTRLKLIRIQNRATVYCPQCQSEYSY